MKSAILILVFLLLNVFAMAQPGDPGGDPDQGVIPIDGGVGFLIAAGAAFGAKKVFDISKKGK